MADTDIAGLAPQHPGASTRPSTWLTRLAASPDFQSWAARVPVLRRFVRREGEIMFDLVAGFCQSQVLLALVRLGIPTRLLAEEMTVIQLAACADLQPQRMKVLLNGGVALGLLKCRKSGHYALTARGAALAGVPGLQGMIAHHDIFYRDLSDPVALLRGEAETELAGFWPYVFSEGAGTDPEQAQTYSRLMADTQTLVAEETLQAVNFADAQHILDVGGGTGAFLAAVGAAQTSARLTLFDLPQVATAAQERFEALGLQDRVQIRSGSFRTDPLPKGADTITLVRVLYDHSDSTVRDLLASAHAALPAGGRLVVSEPMTGGDTPTKAGDIYFALYCMAMRTGRARSAQEIAALLSEAGFIAIATPRTRRPFVTSVVTAVRSA